MISALESVKSGARTSTRDPSTPRFVPTATVGILLAILLDATTATVATAILAILAGIVTGGSFEMASYVLLGGLAGIVAVLFALWLARDVLSRDTGTDAMRDVAGTIYEGAIAFIRRQYSTIAGLAVIGAVVIAAVITVFETEQVADTSVFGLELGIRTGIAFLVGAACSMLSGIIGMYISVKSNVRTAAAARRSLVEAVQVAMRGGAVSGFLVVALSLLGVYGIFAVYGGFSNPAEAPFLIVGFGFGASFVALFAQLGGGIYTKAADVGSDLVGKVEAGIPEDDPRNAGVVADLVGDNVGDCAGRGADLFESTAAENIENGNNVAVASRKTRVSATSRMVNAISLGVLRRLAPSTMAIMRSMKASPGFTPTRITIQSDNTRVPPVTVLKSPPDARITGADSPVIADSSTEATPSITSPSTGTRSPASTSTRSPLRRLLAGTRLRSAVNAACASFLAEVLCLRPRKAAA